MKKKKTLQRILGTMLCTITMVSLFSVVDANAATVGADKDFYSGSYSGASLKTVARASCPTTGTFKWTTSVTDSRKSTLSYIVYRLGDSWSKNTSTKKAVYNWRYTVQKLPTGASGGSTTVGAGSGTATFTYNASKKSLTVE